jgi:Bacterial membrane protein YfhO
LVVAWNLTQLHSETGPVSYLNDGSVHYQMTRFATTMIEHGHLPFTSWFPSIGLGSAQFLHYQSLGSVLTGLAGTVVGPGTAFRWSTYLLISCWPFVIYYSGRIFGLAPAAAAVAAVLSPFMVSYTGVGYERGAYAWIGGAQVWTQLLGSWALPFAWACTWKAFQKPRWAWVACALVALTTALHFLSGYLAFLAIFVMAMVAAGRLGRRLYLAIVLFVGSLAAAAWVIVPLAFLSKWSAINQELAATNYVKGYGARTELGWLFHGQMFDARRTLPVITVAVLGGAVLCLWRSRRDVNARVLPVLFVASLLISFGPTTWGGLADLVPAHADLYFRRFMMGCQLAGIYMAGMAVVALWDGVRLVTTALAKQARVRALVLGLVAVGLIAWFYPAKTEISGFDARDATTILAQQEADTTQGSAIAPLVNYIKRHGGGRTYAGLGSNWGQSFTVGLVPVYKYLEAQDVDEMTYIVPSLSLMLDAEADFDEDNPSDYPIFGIRYILVPYGMSPPVPARRLLVSGTYALWQVPSSGYATTIQVAGTINSNRSDIGSQSLTFLASVAPHEDSAVGWPGLPPPPPSDASPDTSTSAPGQVQTVDAHLSQGSISISVKMGRPGSLLISLAYDPGWHAWVNGKPTATEMLAPAVEGVKLGTGSYNVQLRYYGFRWYPELWAGGLAGLVAVWSACRRKTADSEAGAGASRPIEPMTTEPMAAQTMPTNSAWEGTT